MDPAIERSEPDEARPSKRVRLEAPLAVTEAVQEEIYDDSDWADIYDNPNPPPTNVPEAPSQPIEEKHTAGQSTDIEAKTEDGVPLEAIDNSGDDLVSREEPEAGADKVSEQVLNETTVVETEEPWQDEDEVSRYLYGGTPVKRGDAQTDVENGHITPSKSQPDQDSHTIPPVSKPNEDPEFVAAAEAQKKDENAEWQLDSDAEDSSDSDSDSSSDDSSDDSDSGSEGGYEMLDPATAAKILMAGEGDDGGNAKDKNGDHQPRTANEVKDEIVPKPDVVVTENMKITYLGTVERTVDNLILIKAATPGEYQVLESGSVLCKENREVLGAVAETFGRVQEPMYSVAFTNSQEIEDMGMSYGSTVYYVDDHSKFVFTQPLKNLKGTDASNIHDEEVGEDEVEFSDDEKEAEYKRMKKEAKKGGRGGLSRAAFNEERETGGYEPATGPAFINGTDVPQQQYGGGMNYDDEDVQDEFYSPLKRPDNLSQLMAGGAPPPMPPRGNFGGRGGRGDRGRGRGDRGRGRGGFDNRKQRGGRGGHFFDDPNGGGGQQNGHRGAAHSFPDRHNNSNNRRGNKNKNQFSRRQSNASHSSSPPPQQHYQQGQPYQHPHQHQNHQPSQQQYQQQPSTYQFNGYTFQYGNQPPPQAPSQQPGYYNQQHPASQGQAGSIPAGSYVNPAFFQNQHTQPQYHQSQQPAYGGYPPQQYQQYAQPGAPPPQQQQQFPPQADLAQIMRQLENYQQQQQQR